MTQTITGSRLIQVLKISGGESHLQEDIVAVEEPLEIRLAFGPAGMRQQQSISITMRTPGNDAELATGFLYTEGIIREKEEIKGVREVPSWNKDEQGNIVEVELGEHTVVNMQRLDRHFYTSSSCGVCGKSSIESVRMVRMPDLMSGFPLFSTTLLSGLSGILRQQQSIFELTGGLHAAALFDASGKLCILKEDVGRHNAVDKLVGLALQQDMIPLQAYLLLVSGRVSFELVQKAIMAGIPILAAVGAPSSLAIELAREAGMTIIGFLRDGKMNIYCGEERIDF